MSHLKLECARFLLLAAQLESREPPSPFHLWDWRVQPSPQGRYANRRWISKRRSGGGEGEGRGHQGLASPPKRQVSLGHIHSLREAWAGHTGACSSLFSPQAGAHPLLPLLSAASPGCPHALPSLGSDRSFQALPIPPPTNPIPSPLGSKDP